MASSACSLPPSWCLRSNLIVRGDFAGTVSFFLQPFKPGWTTIVIFALILIGLDAVLGRSHQSLMIVAPLTLSLAVVGHQKSLYLGDPLYPTDFLYARQIVALMPLLVRDRPGTAVTMAVGIVGGLSLLVYGWRLWRRRVPALSRKGRLARLTLTVPLLAFFVSIMDYATFSWTRDRLQIIPIMWDQKENYASNGFALAFALNVPMAHVSAPPGYSDKAIAAIDQAAGDGLGAGREARHHHRHERILLGSDQAARRHHHARPDPQCAGAALGLDVLARIRRHDRQCRIRGADRLFQRLPAGRQHSLPAICARPVAVDGDVPEERGL